MKTGAERLRHISSKIQRAKTHMDDVKRQVAAFLSSQPYRIETKRDPQSRRLIYFISRADPCPNGIPVVAGEVIQNLMTALDHLAFQLVCREVGDAPPNVSKIYFPIGADAATYKRDSRKKMLGAHVDTLALLDTLTPYKSGDDLVWQLQQINNIDKHRTLVTAGGAFQSLDIGASLMATAQKHLNELPNSRFRGEKLPEMPLFVRPADRAFPLSVGTELFIDAPDAEPTPNMRFVFELALHEPPIIDSAEIVETLQRMIERVEEIVNVMAPRLN